MLFFSDSNRDERSDFDLSAREGDGALDVLIILLLIAFTFAIWFVSGTVRPMLADANPSLIAQPAPASGPYTAEMLASRSDIAPR